MGKRLWRLLAGAEKATAPELAAEVVELEGRLPALRAELAAAHEAAVGAAQKRLAGAGPGVLKEAMECESAARLVLEAAERTLEDLRGKLAAAVEAERAAELAPVEAELRKLDEERAAAVEEVGRCVVALAVACYRLEPWQYHWRELHPVVADKRAARTPLVELAGLVCASPRFLYSQTVLRDVPRFLVERVEAEIAARGLDDPAATVAARTAEAKKRLARLAGRSNEERVKAALAAAAKQGTGGTEEPTS